MPQGPRIEGSLDKQIINLEPYSKLQYYIWENFVLHMVNMLTNILKHQVFSF